MHNKAIKVCINFMMYAHYYAIYFYGKLNLCENGWFLLSGPHINIHIYVQVEGKNRFGLGIKKSYETSLKILKQERLPILQI